VRIQVHGSSIVSAHWNGAATYYRGLFRALSRLGHRIDFCEPDIYGRQANRDLATDPDYVRVRVYRSDRELAELQAEARDAELVIKCSGVGARDSELEAWLAGLQGPLRAFWDVDAAHTLTRMEADPGDPLRDCIPAYDLVFTYGGGPPVVARYAALGARACHPIYNALDPDVHRPAPPDPRYEADLLFMGNRLPDRERRVELYFLDVAAGLPACRFVLGGSGWGDRSLPANVRYVGHVPTGLHNTLNGSARLVLNLHRDAMVENGYSPATRLFEAAGAGACQVTDAWTGIEAFFEPETEVLVARTPADVARFVTGIEDGAAARIGRAARARALRDHPYSDRARQVDAVLRAHAS
jgi:spore maturation protein CgeB